MLPITQVCTLTTCFTPSQSPEQQRQPPSLSSGSRARVGTTRISSATEASEIWTLDPRTTIPSLSLQIHHYNIRVFSAAASALSGRLTYRLGTTTDPGPLFENLSSHLTKFLMVLSEPRYFCFVGLHKTRYRWIGQHRFPCSAEYNSAT